MGPRKAAQIFLERHPEAAAFQVTLYGSLAATGKELGIPSLEKGKIELSNFSDKPFALTPTPVSYTHLDVYTRQSTKCRMEREMVHQMSSDILNA